MGKLLDFLSNFIEITGNQTADGIIVGSIALLSFLIAFGIVGKIFEAIGIFSSSLMSEVHWFIRVLVFFGLVFIFTLISKLIAFLMSLPWWIWTIIGASLFAITVLLIVLTAKKRKVKKQNIDN